jgi:hypothetical protein
VKNFRALLLVSVGVYALLLFAPALRAATVTVSWMLPTQYVDNSALAVADIGSTTVEYGSCVAAAFGTKAGQVVASGAMTSTTVDLGPGTYCFRAFVTTVPAKGATSSATSNVATKTVAFPAPKPPTLIDIILGWLRKHFGHFA